MLGGVSEGGRGDEADDLAFQHVDAVSRRFPAYDFEHPENRRLLVVRQVHRDLDDPAILQRDAHRLHETETARAESDRRRNLLRDVQPVGGEIDVVGDERHARADHRGAGGRVRRGTAEVRRPSLLGHFRAQPFELAAPDVLEVAARRIGGRVFVQIDRDGEALRHLGPDFPRQRDAVGHGRALDRDKRHDVDRAQARVLTAVRAQVDVGRRALEERQDGVLEASRVADHGEHRAVVRRVRGMIEQPYAGNATDRLGHRRDDIRPPSLADVGNALDQRHEI